MADAPFTRDDLDELSDAAFEAPDPTEVAAQLLAAARDGRLAEPVDTGYAYQLAAEIHERADDLDTALDLASRALAAYRAHRDHEPGPARAFRAQLLLRLGRDEEAMAELAALRPLMTSSTLAAAYVTEALAGGGRADTAVRWVTDALVEMSDLDPDHPVVAQLRGVRERLTASPGGGGDRVGPDEPEVSDEPLTDDPPYRGGEAVLLVWPRDEYERMDERWPEVLEATGAGGWDDYRRQLQAVIAEWVPRGVALWQVTGTADGFAEFLAEQDADPADADLVRLAELYGDQLAERDDTRLMPPAAADPCWCGSGARYESCCRPRPSGVRR